MAARLAVHVVGPLQPYRDGFAEAMRSEGHAEGPVELHSRVLAHLSRWLLERGLGASDLTPAVLEEFFAGRRTRRRWLATTRAAQPLLRYLRAVGAAPEEAERPPVTAADELVGAFGNWLVCDRGLAAASVELYVRWARHLTARWWQGGGVVPENLDPAAIIALVRDEVERLAAPSARNLLSALRSFLRFLYVTGRTSQPLVAAVPAAAVWRGPQLPRAVPRPVAEDLLGSCDQTTPGGRRDLAVLRLLLRLGLRAGEVAGLELDSIDWRAGEIVVEGKSRRPERLPLPVDVGEAIAAYLRDGRPRVTGRGGVPPGAGASRSALALRRTLGRLQRLRSLAACPASVRTGSGTRSGPRRCDRFPGRASSRSHRVHLKPGPRPCTTGVMSHSALGGRGAGHGIQSRRRPGQGHYQIFRCLMFGTRVPNV